MPAGSQVEPRLHHLIPQCCGRVLHAALFLFLDKAVVNAWLMEMSHPCKDSF